MARNSTVELVLAQGCGVLLMPGSVFFLFDDPK